MTPALLHHNGAVELWLVCDGDSIDIHDPDNELSGDLCEDYPKPARWFFYESGEMGVSWLLGAHDAAYWLLAEGLAPQQPFRVRFERCSYYRDYWTGEHDVEQGDWTIVDRAPWSVEQQVVAWEDWLGAEGELPWRWWKGT